MKLEARQLSLSFADRPILTDVSFTSAAGELIGLIGPNGAGKTSLLKLLARLLKPQSGDILLDGRQLQDWPHKALARHMAYLAQGAPAHWPLPVRRLVELGRLPHLDSWQQPGVKDQQAVEHAMQLAEVTEFAHRPVTELSGGERMRALLARLFATEPTLILADEPIAALDPYHQIHTMELLRDHCERGGSSMVVLHDLNIAARFCHRLLLLDKGSIVSDGTPEEVLNADQLAAVYGIDCEIMSTPNGLIVLPTTRVNRSNKP